MINADGTGERELVGGSEEHLMARWSPDAQRIYFVRFHRGAGQVFAADSNGANVQKLSDGRGYDIEFAIRPPNTPARTVAHR